MAERIDNPWWSEGWRLVRERLPEIVTPRRRRVLAIVVGLGVLIGIAGGLFLVPQIEGLDGVAAWAFTAASTLLLLQIGLGVCFIVWGRQDREPDYRAGRVSLGLEDAFDLRKPVPALSVELREEATIHVLRTRRTLPASVVGHGLFQLLFPLVLVIMAVSGLWTMTAWILLVQFVINAWQPVWFLKLLGSTTAQLRRIESAPEPPTYRGPRGWGIEAPRTAAEGESASS